MSNTLTRNFTNKWVLVLKQYELIKNKQNAQFKTVDELCKFFEIHRKDIRRYYERWIEADRDPKALMPRKPGPRPGQMKLLTKDEERTIMKIRRRFETSGPILHEMIKERFNVPPSVSTIYRIFQRYPLNGPRKKAIKRYEMSYPGELVHSDSYHVDPTMVVDRAKHHLIGVIDDCTRLCYVELVDRATAFDASQVFSRAYKWFMVHGFNVDELMTDNGPEFCSSSKDQIKRMQHAFETTLAVFNVKHIRIQPYHPETNGKIERFWRILQDECLAKQSKTLTKSELIQEIQKFMYYYNYQRRHGSLEFKSPLDKLQKIADLLPEL